MFTSVLETLFNLSTQMRDNIQYRQLQEKRNFAMTILLICRNNEAHVAKLKLDNK